MISKDLGSRTTTVRTRNCRNSRKRFEQVQMKGQICDADPVPTEAALILYEMADHGHRDNGGATKPL